MGLELVEMIMLQELESGTTIRLKSGATAEVTDNPKDGSWVDIVIITLKTAAGLAALAAAAQNWALRRNTAAERVWWTIAGLLLVFPSLLEALAERISGYDVPHPAPLGLAIIAALLLKQYLTRSGPAPAVTA